MLAIGCSTQYTFSAPIMKHKPCLADTFVWSHSSRPLTIELSILQVVVSSGQLVSHTERLCSCCLFARTPGFQKRAAYLEQPLDKDCR